MSVIAYAVLSFLYEKVGRVDPYVRQMAGKNERTLGNSTPDKTQWGWMWYVWTCSLTLWKRYAVESYVFRAHLIISGLF